MERLIEVLRADMNRGFDQINARLDRMNGSVRSHGEHIAVIENRLDRNDRISADCKMECKADIDKLDTLVQAATIDAQAKRRLLAVLGAAAGVVATFTTIIVEVITYWARR